MVGGGPSAASSLYSGIFDAKEEAPVASTCKAEEKDGGADGAKQEVESEASLGGESAAPVKPQAWSAALRFAPRKNIGANAAKSRRPPPSALLSTEFSASSGPGEEESQGSGSTLPAPNTSPERNAAPDETPSTSTKGWSRATGSSGSASQAVQVDALRPIAPQTDSRTTLPVVLGPPELTISSEEIERDKARFHALAEKRGELKKNAHSWDAEWQEEGEEEDINGFANTKEGKKAKRKRNKKKRNGSPGHHGMSASLRMDTEYDVRIPNDYNEFKELIRKRREAIKQMAREQEMAEMVNRSDGLDGRDEDEYGSDDDDEGDSYRRSKMGRFAPPATYTTHKPAPAIFDDDDEKPYLSPPPPEPPRVAATIEAAPAPAAMTGEEAYQRRLAMSQSLAPPISAADSDKPSTSAPDLASRAAAAAAIAARLAKAAPPLPAPPPAEQNTPSFLSSTQQQADSSSFAERLMAKQGWKKGEALGAEGNKGMLDPILAEKVASERQRQRGSTSGGERSVQSNRGTIINAVEEEKRREEKARFGEPSEVILLENMVDLADIDDELSGEIGEECAKHGYVQRVFVWPNGPSGVRIFVRFSGMAGAWRCVKELEGRFFGGKTVRARYYPLIEFERGNYMRVYGQ